MHFIEDYIYHVFNRSNETLFITRDNYIFFINKVTKHILPYCDMLAWCLLPNHFHFLLVVNSRGAKSINEKHRSETQFLSKNIGILLSSYTQAINKQENRKGSLFAHSTVAKQLNLSDNRYPEICFAYIHQNPCESGLVEDPENWEYSSYRDFLGERQENIVNIELAEEMLNIDMDNFAEWSNGFRDQQYKDGIF